MQQRIEELFKQARASKSGMVLAGADVLKAIEKLLKAKAKGAKS